MKDHLFKKFDQTTHNLMILTLRFQRIEFYLLVDKKFEISKLLILGDIKFYIYN